MVKTKAENHSRWLILQAISISSAQIHSFIKQELQQLRQVLNDEPVLADLLVDHQELLVQASELDEDVHDPGQVPPALAPVSHPQHVL